MTSGSREQTVSLEEQREHALDVPRATSEPPPIAAPEDIDFPGTIDLFVDASDVLRGIFRVQQSIPVPTAGPLTLLYPKWLPGYHSPMAQISLFAGLEIRAGGERLAWRRDLVEVHAFHVDVPVGVPSLELTFQFLSPTHSDQGRVVATRELLNLQWNSVLLYPAGFYSRRIEVAAVFKLPSAWRFACAIAARSDGDVHKLDPVSLDVLIDSPIFAGRHFRSIPLDDGGNVRLNLVADRADQLAATPAQIAPHRELVAQADKLFGARHFDHYDFLVSLSDQLGSIGVEHHRCCETGTVPDYFTAWDKNVPNRDVMSHEYTHSWNGKYRRGADSWTPTFDRPIRNSLMWVYEGQTQYWGNVLSARSGLWTAQHARDMLARTAAIYDNRAGRRWRPMDDTTRDPIIASRSPLPWVSWQRSEDYYAEGQLVWLDVDTRLRELSGDARSLDDFARAFFGVGEHGRFVTNTYDFDEVVRTLHELVPYDWASFLHDKLESRVEHAPLDGLTRGGYRLVYLDHPSELTKLQDALMDVLSLRFSVGLTVHKSGKVKEVMWESPAYDVGLTVGSELVAVHGRAYEPELLEHAVLAREPLELLVKSGKYYRTVHIDYQGGVRSPHLQRVEGTRARLDEILAPR